MFAPLINNRSIINNNGPISQQQAARLNLVISADGSDKSTGLCGNNYKN